MDRKANSNMVGIPQLFIGDTITEKTRSSRHVKLPTVDPVTWGSIKFGPADANMLIEVYPQNHLPSLVKEQARDQCPNVDTFSVVWHGEEDNDEGTLTLNRAVVGVDKLSKELQKYGNVCHVVSGDSTIPTGFPYAVSGEETVVNLVYAVEEQGFALVIRKIGGRVLAKPELICNWDLWEDMAKARSRPRRYRDQSSHGSAAAEASGGTGTRNTRKVRHDHYCMICQQMMFDYCVV